MKSPLNDFVVSRNAILGITKSGKTYTAYGISEQLMELKIPIIVFDAIGMWRFLKIPSGKPGGKGFPIVVAGGAQPDLPLNPQTAPQIVRAAIAQNISLVIDLYDPKLSKADWRRIVQDCFRILLFENKGLRHIFLEGAAEYVPQKVMDGQTYAEVEKLARMGGNASLGITFINPRAQELNKAVLELCDNIVLLRQRGTHAIDSLEKQMDKLSPEMAKEIALTMPNMTQGDCWIFTENGDKPTRTRSSLIKSFHPDRRNPEANKIMGQAVNTEDFVSALSGTLEKVIADAKANDPAELKKRISVLQSDIHKLQKSKNVLQTDIQKVPALTDTERKRLTKLIDVHETFVSTFNSAKTLMDLFSGEKDAMRSEIQFFKDLLAGKLAAPNKFIPMLKQPVRVNNPTPAQLPRTVSSADTSNGEFKIGRCERSILTALTQYPQGRSANQVAILSGYSSGSGGFNNSLSSLRSHRFITLGNPIQVTQEGISALGEYDPLPTGQELIRYWLGKLDKCERAILTYLANIYPRDATAQEAAEKTAYAPSSGGFNNALSRLRTLELITRGQPMKASDEFFQ